MNFCKHGVVVCLLVLISQFSLAEEVPPSAATIVPDGTVQYGQLDFEEDVDWYMFTPAAHTLYRISLNKVATGFTDIRAIKIYQKDDFDVLTEVIGWSAGTAGIYDGRGIYTETDRDLYIKVYNGASKIVYYYLKAETLDTYTPDTFGDDLASATHLGSDVTVTGVITRTEGLMDQDWFEVDLTGGHVYRFDYDVLCDNAGISMKLLHTDGIQAGAYYSDGSGTTYYSPEALTLMVRFTGTSTKIGELYEFTFIDEGAVVDDHSDLYPGATDVTGTLSMVGAMDFNANYGGENYGGDIDWFKFTPEPNTLYDIAGVMEAGTSRKDLRIYQIDQFGTLGESIFLYGDRDNQVYIEGADDVYVKVYGASGGYAFDFTAESGDYADGYSDEMASADSVDVDVEHLGSIARSNPLDVDWLTFTPLDMHRYQLSVTYQSTSSSVKMKLYCNDVSVSGDETEFEMIAHAGSSYKIRLRGDSNRFSEAYRFQITDMGLVDVADDHANGRIGATAIDTDTTPMDGSIEYASGFGGDEDFFVFDAVSGDYTFTINGGAPTGYKRVYIYRVNDLDQLVEVGNTYSYYEDTPKSITKTLAAGPHFLKVRTDGIVANYQLTVESPEPRCGDEAHPYPVGDISGPDGQKDCVVDMYDVAAMGSSWLEDSRPQNSN